jgi:alpha-glucosidase
MADGAAGEAGDGPEGNPPWWQTGVLYQIYPRSFADSNGDGIGDLPGVLAHLDHLAWLGIDGLWLSPVTVSPNADWGYDVADYCDIDPSYGTLADLDELVARAGERGIRVLMDLVPNHTSDRNAWFQEARSSRDAPHRDFYVWADAAEGGGPPNNWISVFGGPAWEWDETTAQYYLHNFEKQQPDLNWWNPEVWDAFDRIQDFWWDRGVAGFRIDVVHMMIKDKLLRDNPPAGPDDSLVQQVFGQKWLYNEDRPEVHDILRHWRTRADARDPGRVLIGETSLHRLERMAAFYGDGTDELHMGFNFPFIESPFEAEALSGVVARTLDLLPERAWPVWTGSNHDVSRLATRWAAGDPAKVRAALTILLTLRGTPVLYQGDEIGLEDGEITEDDLLDPVGRRFWPHYKGRDPERTPMPWRDGPGAGFTTAGATPWLPLSDPGRANVATQHDDPGSVLHFTRRLIALRRETPALVLGPYEPLDAPEGVWAWSRGSGVAVAANLGTGPAEVDLPGNLLLSTVDRRDRPAGPLVLAPSEAVVVAGQA